MIPVWALAALLTAADPVPPPSPPAASLPLGERFVGERLQVEITAVGGLFHAADLRVGYDRGEGGEYVAWMETQGVGITLALTRFRANRYESHMRVSPDGARLIPHRFTRWVRKSNRILRSTHTFDYDRREWSAEVWDGDRLERQETRPIPEGVIYENPLSAVYNFRLGVYGPLSPGREYRIQAIPKEEENVYPVRMAGPEETAAYFAGRPDLLDPQWMMTVDIPKEVFNVQTDRVRFVMDAGRVPLEGRAENVIGFTDVVGRLVQSESQPVGLPPTGVILTPALPRPSGSGPSGLE